MSDGMQLARLEGFVNVKNILRISGGARPMGASCGSTSMCMAMYPSSMSRVLLVHRQDAFCLPLSSIFYNGRRGRNIDWGDLK